jgi:hypothetical protein
MRGLLRTTTPHAPRHRRRGLAGTMATIAFAGLAFGAVVLACSPCGHAAAAAAPRPRARTMALSK